MREISKSTRAKAEPKIKRERERKEPTGIETSSSFFPRKKKLALFLLSKGQRKGMTKKKDSVRESREDLAGFTRALLTKTIYIYIVPAASFFIKPRLPFSAYPGRGLLSL